jgi:hypothetical protein
MRILISSLVQTTLNVPKYIWHKTWDCKFILLRCKACEGISEGKKTLEEGQTMNTHHGPWVDYKFQNAKFFQDVKKLLATR